MTDRFNLLSEYGRFYGEQRFAVAFTAGTEGDAAKRIVTPGWDKTVPLASGDFGAAFVAGRGTKKNPAIVLRPSNLIALECDSEEDLLRVESLKLPQTLSVRSSAPYKRHWYFRPAETLEALPYVAFRFESGKITADAGRYFLAPPALHPSGAVYSFINGPETPIATLPEEAYRWLSEQAREEDAGLRTSLEFDVDAKIKEGNRRGFIFRYACMLRRWGHSEREILELALRYNEFRCEPPLEPRQVALQVAGAMKKEGNQEIVEPVETDGVRLNYEPLDLFQPVPPVDWVIENICVGSEATLLVADGGSGKSYFALAACKAVAGGTPFLGCNVRQGKVIYVDEEGSRDLALQRMAELGFTDDEKREIHYLNFAGVDMVRFPERLLEDAKILRPVFIVIDSHAKVTRVSEENSNSEMGKAWDDGFLPLARETGAALLVIHHTSKDGSGRGATQIRNSADQVLTMSRQEDDSQVVWPSKPRRLTEQIQFKFTPIAPHRYELQKWPIDLPAHSWWQDDLSDEERELLHG